MQKHGHWNTKGIPAAVWCLCVGQTHWNRREYSSPVGQTSSSPELEHGRSKVHIGASPKSSGEIQSSKNIIHDDKLSSVNKSWFLSHTNLKFASPNSPAPYWGSYWRSLCRKQDLINKTVAGWVGVLSETRLSFSPHSAGWSLETDIRKVV